MSDVTFDMSQNAMQASTPCRVLAGELVETGDDTMTGGY
jgi:hypothetical protein